MSSTPGISGGADLRNPTRTSLYVKALSFRTERDNSLNVSAMVTNRAEFETEPLRLTVALYDAKNVMVGRAAALVPALKPYGTVSVDAKCRLREECFFTATCRLEKLRDVDYSEFDFLTHSWNKTTGGRDQFSGRKLQ